MFAVKQKADMYPRDFISKEKWVTVGSGACCNIENHLIEGFAENIPSR